MTFDDAYEALGIDQDADEKTVRRAYAKLAKKYRPDTHPEEFAKIRSAYDRLLEALQNETYQDPDLPIAPNLNETTQTPLPTARVVSYVMDEQDVRIHAGFDGGGDGELGDEFDDAPYTEPSQEKDSGDDELPDDEVVYEQNENSHSAPTNPLQSLENQLVDAIKAVKPGQLDSENKVVLLADEYLAASNNHSRDVREYVERFLIGACLGDYYLPHAVRERVADFTGLGNAFVDDSRLSAWEHEFIHRFEESELLEELLNKAASRRNRVEHAVIHDSGWSTAVMLRMDSKETHAVHHWMRWLDQLYGEDAGIVNESFRDRWHRLRQIEPIDASVLLLFAAMMAISGLAIQALGVPLSRFFSLPMPSLISVGLLLAVLSWANFVLLQLARPVVRQIVDRERQKIYENVPGILLVVECVAIVTVIVMWVWLEELPNPRLGSAVLGGAIGLLWCVALFARDWVWTRGLSFGNFVMRFFSYYVCFLIAENVTPFHTFGQHLGLILALTVAALPPTPLQIWMQKTEEGVAPSNEFVSLRFSDITFRMQTLRTLLFVGAFACLLGIVLPYVTPVSVSLLPKVISTVLLMLLALDLALSGGIHQESHGRARSIGYAGAITLTFFAGLVAGPSHEVTVSQVGIASLLLYLGVQVYSSEGKPRKEDDA